MADLRPLRSLASEILAADMERQVVAYLDLEDAQKVGACGERHGGHHGEVVAEIRRREPAATVLSWGGGPMN